jgi:hypothetical protein
MWNNSEPKFRHAAFIERKAAAKVFALKADMIEERHNNDYMSAFNKEKRRPLFWRAPL